MSTVLFICILLHVYTWWWQKHTCCQYRCFLSSIEFVSKLQVQPSGWANAPEGRLFIQIIRFLFTISAPTFRLPSVLYTCLALTPSLVPQANLAIISGSAWHSSACHSASRLSFLQMLVGSVVHRREQGTGAAAQCRRAPVVAL